MTSLMCAKHGMLVQMRFNIIFYEYFLLKLDTFKCGTNFYSLRAGLEFIQLKWCWLLHVDDMNFLKNEYGK